MENMMVVLQQLPIPDAAFVERMFDRNVAIGFGFTCLVVMLLGAWLMHREIQAQRTSHANEKQALLTKQNEELARLIAQHADQVTQYKGVVQDRRSDRDKMIETLGRIDGHLLRSAMASSFDAVVQQLLSDIDRPGEKRRATDKALTTAISRALRARIDEPAGGGGA